MILSRGSIGLALAVVALGIATATSPAESSGDAGIDPTSRGGSHSDVGWAEAASPSRPSLQRVPQTPPDRLDRQVTTPAAPTDLTVHPLPNRYAKLSWSWTGTRTATYDVEFSASTISPPRVESEDTAEHVINLDKIDTHDRGLRAADRVAFRVRAKVGGTLSAWSETVTIVDSPLLQRGGSAYFHSGDAYLRWAAVSDAFGYEVRYRKLSGDHSDTSWEVTSWEDTASTDDDWQDTDVRLGTVSGTHDKMAIISGLTSDGPIYAVQLNYETPSGKVFSARSAYIWASSVKPDTDATPRGLDRVATFPYYGHLTNREYRYRICTGTFPDAISDTKHDDWARMIVAAIETWETATNREVITTRDADMDTGKPLPCDTPDWREVSWWQRQLACLAPGSCDFLYGLQTALAFLEEDEFLEGNLFHIMNSEENNQSEVRIIDTREPEDVEFITSIYKTCVAFDAKGCAVSPAYDRSQRGDEPVSAADIYLRWRKIADAPTIPIRTQFNECIPKDEYEVYKLVVHESGHAVGLSGASPEATIRSAIADLPFAGPFLASLNAVDADEAYRVSHPTAGPSVMTYDEEIDCFPHPLDVLAVHALYQDQYTPPTATARPMVNVSRVSSPVTEGGFARFTVTRTSSTASALTVWLRVTDAGNRTSAGTGLQKIVIPSGQQSATLIVFTVRDGVAQQDSAVIATVLRDDTSYAIGSSGSATVIVTDPPPPPTVTISAKQSPAEVKEGGDAEFTISRTGATDSALTVLLDVSERDGDRVSSDDSGGKSFQIDIGKSSDTFRVPTVDEPTDADHSKVDVIVLHSASYDRGSPFTATVTVNDNETTIELMASLITVEWPGVDVSLPPDPNDPLPAVFQGVPLTAIWYFVGDEGEWIVYIFGAPFFVNSVGLGSLVTGEMYVMRATATYDWVVTEAGNAASSSNASRDGAAEDASDSGWTARVTCDSGPSPVRFSGAPTEAEAVSAATWFINSPQGCGGAGTYTTTPPPAPDGQ